LKELPIIEFNRSIEFQKIIEIFWPYLYANLYSCGHNQHLCCYYLEDIQNDGTEWFMNFSETTRRPENFYPVRNFPKDFIGSLLQ
jgi:hypothetical protein